MFCPEIHAASSDASHVTALEISAGSPIRLKAERLAIRLMSSAVFPVVKRSVITGPGDTTFTRMPLKPISFAKTWLICSTAPLVATYVAQVGSARAVVEDEKVM